MAGTVDRSDFSPDAHVQQHLRIGHQVVASSASDRPDQRDRPQDVQRRAEAVAGEQVVREDDVARLLAAEREAAREHLLHHVLVADGAAHEPDARFAQARARGRCCSSRSRRSPRLSGALRAAADGRTSAARHRRRRSAPLVDEDRAIAVAVERDAERAAPVSTTSCASRSGCVEPQPQIDVAAVGVIADDDGSSPSARNNSGATGRGRAVARNRWRCSARRAPQDPSSTARR